MNTQLAAGLAVVGLGLGAAGAAVPLLKKIRALEERLAITEGRLAPTYGILSKVNRIVLAEEPHVEQCVIWDCGRDGDRDCSGQNPKGEVQGDRINRGVLTMDREFVYTWGVDAQSWDWESNIDIDAEGIARIKVPDLQQLTPDYAYFTRVKQDDDATGNRLERMFTKSKSAAIGGVNGSRIGVIEQQLRYERKGLGNNSILEQSRASMAEELKLLLNAAMRTGGGGEISTVVVTFSNEGDFEPEDRPEISPYCDKIHP